MINPEIAARLHERLRAAPAPASVPGSLPVLFFGDLFTARTVTVGLNPSDREYVDRRGAPLLGADQRFATLPSLGAGSRADLTEDQCADAVRCMRGYHDPHRPVHRWFTHLSRVVDGFGVRYDRRQAAHLDLVQEATRPTWSSLPDREREDLLHRDLRFLSWQLRTFPVRTVLCTSSTAGRHVRALLDVTVLEEDKLELVTWWTGRATVGDREVFLAGWNVPLARATGLGAAGETELGRILAAHA